MNNTLQPAIASVYVVSVPRPLFPPVTIAILPILQKNA